MLKAVCILFVGDGSAASEELRRSLGHSHPASHTVSEPTHPDRRPQETQLHSGPGTASSLIILYQDKTVDDL